jgi:hypothetical protein
MYRRKKKGLGIVLKQVENVAESAGINGEEATETLFSLKDPKERRNYRVRIIKEANHPEMAELFFTFNGQEWCRKPKNRFVKVRWFEIPSEYENKSASKQEAWLPSDWLRKL